MQAARFLMLVGAASWAADPFGTWKCKRESLTLRIAPHPRGEVFTMDTVGADRRALTSSTILYFDGKPRDFPDPSCSETQSSRRVDARTVDIQATRLTLLHASCGRVSSFVGKKEDHAREANVVINECITDYEREAE